MKRAMQQGLEALNELLPGSFQLPLDPRIEVGKIIVSKCRVMDSAKKPLWLVFENAEEGGDPVTVMFKAGDDVRQDCLTLQLVRLMDEMWRDEGLDLAMEPYKRDGMMGTFKDPSFSDWIRANNPDPRSHKAAVDLFSRSCAGYCVATCVLGIGDRHNDNIMIQSSGRYFHIDFGHFLGHLKYYKLGIRRERTPFVFTNEMAYVLGGVEGKDFAKFVDTACTAYCVLRRQMHLLVSLLLLMVPADMPELTGRDDINHIVTTLAPEVSDERAPDMPELTGRDDINHIVTTLAPEVSDERARESFEQTIHFCLDSRFKRFDNYLHNIAHAFG
ncbi:Phosphatidylinositol Kinase [Phytophthora palmivora]|uniref:Phosphatidylinositol Kinase n=1 Tax=Phytophthora palmivora TaxID=4796 RepID=A0A2P4X9D5_9STRA|nr:Phosphatidylinositol Kinase [Phytophthora palmivora]